MKKGQGGGGGKEEERRRGKGTVFYADSSECWKTACSYSRSELVTGLKQNQGKKGQCSLSCNIMLKDWYSSSLQKIVPSKNKGARLCVKLEKKKNYYKRESFGRSVSSQKSHAWEPLD